MRQGSHPNRCRVKPDSVLLDIQNQGDFTLVLSTLKNEFHDGEWTRLPGR